MENNTNIQMPFDMSCAKFSENLTALVNSANLPVTAVYLILKDVLSQVENIKENTRLNQEREYLEKTGQVGEKIITGKAEIVTDEDDNKIESAEE